MKSNTLLTIAKYGEHMNEDPNPPKYKPDNWTCTGCGATRPWEQWVSAIMPMLHRCDLCYLRLKDAKLIKVKNDPADPVNP